MPPASHHPRLKLVRPVISRPLTNEYPHHPPRPARANRSSSYSLSPALIPSASTATPGRSWPSRRSPIGAWLPAWAVVLALLLSGAGLTLNPLPLNEAPPAPWELGRLLPQGPGLYRLALCAGETQAFPLAEGAYQLSEPLSQDPLVGRLELVNDSAALQVTAVLPGQTLLGLSLREVDEAGVTGEPVTVLIHLQVGFCGDEAASLDPEVADYLNASFQARHPAAGYLFSMEQADHYRLIACQGDRYSYLFQGPAQVRNGATSDPLVADLVLQNPPGRLTVYALGPGTATLSLEVDGLEFPRNSVAWEPVTLEVAVVYCGQAPPADGAQTGPGSLDLPAPGGQTSGDSSQSAGDAGPTGSFQTTSITVSGSGSGSVAVSQSLGVTGTGITGDQDEALGTTSDDGTSFAAHVELNPGDTSSIFVGLNNQGANDIAYTLWLDGAEGVTVSAQANGPITNLIQTCTYCFKFVLPGGAGGAGTGLTLNFALPDDASPGFYSLGQVKIKAMNV